MAGGAVVRDAGVGRRRARLGGCVSIEGRAEVAGGAGCRDLGVIHGHDAEGCGAQVAGGAIHRCAHMAGGLRRGAEGVAGEVAGFAGADDGGVIDLLPDLEDQRGVAGITGVVRRDVVRGLRWRVPGVADEVAHGAIPGHDGVVEVCRGELLIEEGRVAEFAGFGGRDVIHRLADGDEVVVAGGAGLLIDRGVVEHGAAEGEDGVAGRTVVADHDVVCGLAGCEAAVMAGRAGRGDGTVVEPGVADVRCDVAVIAGIRRRDVIGGLAEGAVAIVAGHAGLRDVRVVDGEGDEVVRGVTLGTVVARWRVPRELAPGAFAIVTAHAGTRRAGEFVIDVAGFADDLRMSAGQGKSGGLAMFETGDRVDARDGFLRRGGNGRQNQNAQSCEEAQGAEKTRLRARNNALRRQIQNRPLRAVRLWEHVGSLLYSPLSCGQVWASFRFRSS